ncbi:MAG: Uma2 family endonuclease [Vicinamibacterales bacterium]
MSERPSTWGTLPGDGTTLTTTEYLKTAESVRVQELIYGKLRVADSPTPMHQALLLRLAMILDGHVRDYGSGSIWIAPLDVILDAPRAVVVQPDLFFVSKMRAHIISDHIWGAPDMALEVVSPHPRVGKLEERIEIFGHYGVRECWVVHQLLKEIEIIELTNMGSPNRRRYGPADQLQSNVLPTFYYTAGQLAGWE